MTTRRGVFGLAFLLVFFCTSHLFAGVGLKGGFSLTGLHSATGDFRHVLGYELDRLRMGNLSSFQIGMFDTFDVSRSFALQPEVYYSVRGGDATAEFEFGKPRIRTTIHYLEFPFLLEYRIPLQGRLRPNLFIGPYGALKLSADKQTVTQGKEERVELDNVSTLDYGLMIGGSVEHDVFSGQLILDVRSNLGLKNIMTVPDAYIRLYEEDDKIRNFAFSLMIGYRF